MQSAVKTKRCRRCGEDKPHAEFYRHPHTKDGLQSRCRECDKTAARKWHESNSSRAEFKARRRAYYAQNREVFAESGKAMLDRYKSRTDEELDAAWHRLRPNGVRKCRLCLEMLPRESFYASRRHPDGRNPACISCLFQRSRDSRWQPEWTYTECYLGCGTPVGPDLDFHIEHVVPLSRGGPDVPENRLPSCPECNRGVGGKWSQTATEYLAKTGRAIPAYLVGLEARMWDLSKTPD